MSGADDEMKAPGSALDVDAQAADLLIRRRNPGGWSAEDQTALDAWLAQSVAHQTAYWRLELCGFVPTG